MGLATWAEQTARAHLELSLPRRSAHTQGVAARARTLAPLLSGNAELLEAAAWLHDIGYAPAISQTGFHPLDGARYLRDVLHADPMLCRLVAHHSCAVVEAEERGLASTLVREFEAAPGDLTDALIYCDMTTGPDGNELPVEERLAEIRARYGPDHLVTRSIMRSGPEIAAAVAAIAHKLARHSGKPTATACW